MFMSSQRSHCVVCVVILRLGLLDGTELCTRRNIWMTHCFPSLSVCLVSNWVHYRRKRPKFVRCEIVVLTLAVLWSWAVLCWLSARQDFMLMGLRPWCECCHARVSPSEAVVRSDHRKDETFLTFCLYCAVSQNESHQLSVSVTQQN